MELDDFIPQSERDLRARPNLAHRESIDGFSFATVKQVVNQFVIYREPLYRSCVSQLKLIHFLRKLSQNPMSVPTDVKLYECNFNEESQKFTTKYGCDELKLFTPQKSYLAFKIASLVAEHIRVGQHDNLRFKVYQLQDLALPNTNSYVHFTREEISHMMNLILRATEIFHFMQFDTSKPLHIIGDLHIKNPIDGNIMFNQTERDGIGSLKLILEPNLKVTSSAAVLVAVDSDAGAIRLSGGGGTIKILFVSTNGNTTDNSYFTIEYLRYKLKIPAFSATDFDFYGLCQGAAFTTSSPRLATWSHILRTKYPRIFVKQEHITDAYCNNARVPTPSEHRQIMSLLTNNTVSKVPAIVEEVNMFERRWVAGQARLCGTSQLVNGRELIEREINLLLPNFQHPHMFDFDLFFTQNQLLNA